MKKLVFLQVLTIFLIMVATYSAGCSCPLNSGSLYGLKVTGDNTGGAIAVYIISKNDKTGVHAQRISPGGKTAWGEEGVFLGSSEMENMSFFDIHITSDGSGGAVIGWVDIPADTNIPVSHIARIDQEGKIRWQSEVIVFKHIISDGAGGAIIATDYSYDERSSFIIKIDSDGNFTWGEKGVSIRSRDKYQSNTLRLVSDGDGGAIVIWEELQTEPGPEPHQPKTTNRIFAQRINTQGDLPWGKDGVILYTTPEGVFSEEIEAISDGSGSAIAVWMQVPEGKVEEGSPEALLMDLFVQKVDTSGNISWRPNGVPMEIVKAAGYTFPSIPVLVSDSSGGAIVIWRDMRQSTNGGSSIYAQKIGADGSQAWAPGGMHVASAALNPFFSIVSDSSGGAIFSYSAQGGLHVQKLNTDGKVVWKDNGVLVTDSDCDSHFLASDGQGGVIIAWGRGEAIFEAEKASIQRIDAAGRFLWGTEGIQLHP